MTDETQKFYAYTAIKIHGPFAADEISKIPGFNNNMLVCPSNALGQWREASQEPAFSGIAGPFGAAQKLPSPPKPPEPGMLAAEFQSDSSHEYLPESSFNAAPGEHLPSSAMPTRKEERLEKELAELRRELTHERQKIQDETLRKDLEIRTLSEKLRRSIDSVRTASAGSPSWEALYKTLKKRSEDKIFELTQSLSEKNATIAQMKKQAQSAADARESEKRLNEERENRRVAALEEQLSGFRRQ